MMLRYLKCWNVSRSSFHQRASSFTTLRSVFSRSAPLKYMIARRRAVDAALGDDRLAVADLRLVAVHVLQRVVVAEHVLDVEALEVRRPAFVNPHVRHVGGRDGVAEPLVPALVDDDEVELQADADAGPVALEVAVREAVAVGDRALVLHARVGHFDQLVAVLPERVLAEVLLECLEHRPGLRELALRLLQVSGQHVEVERQVAEPIGEVLVARRCSARRCTS